jgi:hypothetical protein
MKVLRSSTEEQVKNPAAVCDNAPRGMREQTFLLAEKG